MAFVLVRRKKYVCTSICWMRSSPAVIRLRTHWWLGLKRRVWHTMAVSPDSSATRARAEVHMAGETLRLIRDNALGKGDVLVVHCGGVTQDVFRLLVAESTLPAVLEGANTANLVQMLGKGDTGVLDERPVGLAEVRHEDVVPQLDVALCYMFSPF